MIDKSQEEIMKNWNYENMEIPMVSVRCIAYNQENYIAKTLDSFLMQKTKFPFEIIIHDDASIDKTPSIIHEYEIKYPKIIKAIYEKENLYSKEGGELKHIMDVACKGKYIAFCDGDDYWSREDKLQIQVDFLEKNPEYGLCITDADIYIENENRFIRKIVKKKVTIFDFKNPYKSVGYLCNVTWCIRRSIKEKITDNSKTYLDDNLKLFYDFSLYSKVKFFNIVTGVYRRNSLGVSSFTREIDDKKKYIFTKSNFLFLKDYLPKFPNSEINLRKLYIENFFFLYKHALEIEDDQIINDYQNYLKETNFDIITLFESGYRALNSKSYKIGRLILSPLRFLRKLLTKKGFIIE